MNLKALIDRYRTEANDKVEPYFCADPDVKQWLNEAVVEACFRGRLIHESIKPSVTQIPVTAGRTAYNIHAALYEIDFIAFAVSSDGSDKTPLHLTSVEEMDKRNVDWRNEEGAPRFAIQYDKTLRLAPRPSTSGVIFLEGFRIPLIDMCDAEDEPEINEAHHKHLVEWVLHKAFSVPDAEFFDRDRSQTAKQAFIDYFGIRPDADLRRRTREDVTHHIEAFWV